MQVKLTIDVTPEQCHAIHEIYYQAAGPANYERVQRWLIAVLWEKLKETNRLAALANLPREEDSHAV